MRTAIVVGGADSIEQVEAYMPANYSVRRHYVKPLGADRHGWVLVITGEDEAGWTLDGYVIPRLASGLIGAEEIGPSRRNLSHRDYIMKENEMPICEVCNREFDPTTGVLVRGWAVVCDEHDAYQPLTDRGRSDLETIQARGS